LFTSFFIIYFQKKTLHTFLNFFHKKSLFASFFIIYFQKNVVYFIFFRKRCCLFSHFLLNKCCLLHFSHFLPKKTAVHFIFIFYLKKKFFPSFFTVSPPKTCLTLFFTFFRHLSRKPTIFGARDGRSVPQIDVTTE